MIRMLWRSVEMVGQEYLFSNMNAVSTKPRCNEVGANTICLAETRTVPPLAQWMCLFSSQAVSPFRTIFMVSLALCSSLSSSLGPHRKSFSMDTIVEPSFSEPRVKFFHPGECLSSCFSIFVFKPGFSQLSVEILLPG